MLAPRPPMSGYRHAHLATTSVASSPAALSLYAIVIVCALASGYVTSFIGWVAYWVAVIVILDAFMVVAWFIEHF